jgi:hypothetical protein
MAEISKKELTVREALRAGLIAEHRPTLSATPLRLLGRLFRRPAGNSARLWARIELADPFQDERYRSRKLDYTGVYAKGRFVRMGSAPIESKPKKKAKDPHDDMTERLKKAKERREAEEATRKQEAAKKPPAPVVAPKPVAQKAPEKAEPSEVDRRPPMPVPAGKRRKSGRMSTRLRSGPPSRVRPIVAGALSIQDRRPPMPGQREDEAAPVEPETSEETAAPVEPMPLPKPATPPVAKPPPVAKKPPGGGGLNDLFGGSGEGRLRIRKPPSEEKGEE